MAGANTDIESIEKLIKDEKYSEIEGELQSLSSVDLKHPSALFARGLIEPHGKLAVKYFNNLVQDHHDSPFADDALFRIAQFFYSQENYNSAKSYFSLLNRHYSSSKYKDESQYLYCQCLIAQGSADSARMFLKAFIKNVPRSPYVDFAVLDLEELSSFISPGQNSIGETTGTVFNYSIQVGAFSDRKNAQKFASRLHERKISTEIIRKKVGRRELWAVWIGKFATKNSAKEYGDKNLKRLFDDYQIVDRNS